MRLGFLSLLLAASLASAALQELQLNGVPVQLEADTVEVDLTRRVATLDGAATIRLSDRVFTADRLELHFADPDHPAILATGQVRFDDPDQGLLTGDSLRYDMALARGEVSGVEVSVPLKFRAQLYDLLPPPKQPDQLRIRAAQGSREGGTWRLEDAHLTTSSADPPQFEFRAGTVEIRTGDQGVFGDVKSIRGQDLKLQVYGSTLLGLSNLQLGEGGVFFPSVGFNDTYGLFAEYSFAPVAIRPARFTVRPRLGTKTLLSGQARFAIGAGPGVFEVIGDLKARRTLLKTGDVALLSRIPEIAWKVGDRETPGGGRFSSRLSYGLYQEQDHLTTWRAAAQADYQMPLYQGQSSRVGMTAEGWLAWYQRHGNTFGWMGAGLQAEKRFGYRLYTGLDFRTHQVFGRTPLWYDQVDITTELSARMRLKLTEHWLLGTELLVDLNDGVLRRRQFSATYRDRQLEYGFQIVTTPGFEFNLDAKILGL